MKDPDVEYECDLTLQHDWVVDEDWHDIITDDGEVTHQERSTHCSICGEDFVGRRSPQET